METAWAVLLIPTLKRPMAYALFGVSSLPEQNHMNWYPRVGRSQQVIELIFVFLNSLCFLSYHSSLSNQRRFITNCNAPKGSSSGQMMGLGCSPVCTEFWERISRQGESVNLASLHTPFYFVHYKVAGVVLHLGSIKVNQEMLSIKTLKIV